MRKKVADLKTELEQTKTDNQNLESDKTLRAKAERALKLAQIMLNKKIIKADVLEATTEKLTVMDDISYSMMENWVNAGTFGEKVSEQLEKKAFKQKGGLSHLMLMPSKNETMRDKFTNMFMSKPKYAKLNKALAEFYNK